MNRSKIIYPFLVTVFILLPLTGCDEGETPVAPVVDHIAPAVEWISPESGAELSGVIELAFSVYDEVGIDSACVYINGSLFGEGRHSCPPTCTDTLFALPWNTTDFDDGVYILEARAWDEAGNWGTSPSLLVNVRNGDEPPPEDCMPPDIWWTAPDPGSTLADTVRLRLGVFDEGEVDSVLFLKNGAAVATIIPPYTSGGNNANIPPYYCRGGQRGGQVTFTGEITSNTMYDKPVQQAVQATLMQAVQAIPPYYCGRGQRGGQITCTGEITSNSTYDKPVQQAVQATLMQAVQAIPPYYCGRGQRGGQIPFTGEITSNATYDKPVQQAVQATQPPSIEGGDVDSGVDYLWDTRADSDGVYVWEARAWDDCGNMGTSPALLVRVKNNPEPPPEDNSPPVVSWCSPEPGDTLEGTVELRFQVLDDVGVDSVKVYLNGREWQILMDGGQFLDCHVNWITSEVPDGNYIVEVRAWDSSGNMGSSVGVVFTVWNNRPRVIWVPDDFEKIQNAINASEDGDTVRVRAGTYYEGLRLMGKNIWLESEEGPEVTFLAATGWNDAVRVAELENYISTIIIGFTIYSGNVGIQILQYSGITIYNCIFRNIACVEGFDGVWFAGGHGYIYNCVFDSCYTGITGGYSVGDFRNSIFIRCYGRAYNHYASFNNWITYGWNLFWNNKENYSPRDEPHYGDVFSDPQFIRGTYVLSENSPAIDAGDTSIQDKDGSRSDIGVHGGPYSYTTQ